MIDEVDEIKVRAVVALIDELAQVYPDDLRYPAAIDRLDRHWRALSTAEREEVDRILGSSPPA